MTTPMRWLASVALVLAWLPLHAEVIQLKNGNKITGKLTAINGDTFVVKTDYGEIQVPRTDVVSITFTDTEAAKPNATPPAPAIDEALVETAYVNHTAGFQATVPKGWRLWKEMPKGNGTVAALISEDQTLFFIGTSEAFTGNLATYEVLAETQFKSNFANYEKLAETQTTLDRRNGVQLVFHGENKDKPGIYLKFVVYILPYEGRMVRLAFFTLEPLFDAAQPVFKNIAASYGTIPALGHLPTTVGSAHP